MVRGLANCRGQVSLMIMNLFLKISISYDLTRIFLVDESVGTSINVEKIIVARLKQSN